MTTNRDKRHFPFMMAVCLVHLALASCSTAVRPTYQQIKAATPAPKQQSPKSFAVVKSRKANLRSKPTATSKVVRRLAAGDRLDLTQERPHGPWFAVSQEQSTAVGWIHGNAIDLVTAAPQTSRPQRATKTPDKAASQSNDRSYINVDGVRIRSPVFTNARSSGASARCRDGSYSFSQNRRGTCWHHGGVAVWY